MLENRIRATLVNRRSVNKMLGIPKASVSTKTNIIFAPIDFASSTNRVAGFILFPM